MARTRNWYPGEPAGVYADQFRPDAQEDAESDAEGEQTQAVGLKIEPEPQEEEGEPVDIDDLSKGPREVLAIIAELQDDRVHPIKETDISPLMELDNGRLPGILGRLRELELIRRDGVGVVSFSLTARGKEIAEEIQRYERIG